MALGPNHGNPFIEGIYPCTDPEIIDVNCEDCPVYPDCAKDRKAGTPQDEVPFPGAYFGKNLRFIADRVLVNTMLNNLRAISINVPKLQTGKINVSIFNQQFLGF